MKVIYNKFHWPEKNFKPKKPNLYYLNEIFYCPIFLYRKVFFSLDSKNYKLIPHWYCDDYLSNVTRRNLLFFKFFYFPDFLFNLFIKFNFFFFKREKLKLDSNDIIILGPYLNNHAHKILEFLLRLFILKEFKNIKKVLVPDELKVLIYSSKINIYLNNIKIIYYKSYKNYLFYNANYLSHIEIRHYNSTYEKAVEGFKRFINSHKFIRNSKYKYIFISRDNNKRNLINEDELFRVLEPLGFVKINFEKLNIKKQIEISRNAKIIIGYHGAGLSNCFFMDKNNYFIEIVNSHYNHPLFKLTSKIYQEKFLTIDIQHNELAGDAINMTNSRGAMIKLILETKRKLIMIIYLIIHKN
jgi:hypothetical protein